MQTEETLPKYATCAADKLGKLGDWELFVEEERGLADISEGARDLPHKTARLLNPLQRAAFQPVIQATQLGDRHQQGGYHFHFW